MSLEYFGLVPLFSAAAAANRIAGYRAPEVVETRKVMQKSDVYSFGVLLLELLTGKAPNQASLNDEGIVASVIHSFRGSFTNSQRERSLDPSMAAGRAAVGTRWMETAPLQRYLLCSKIRQNSLSGRRLDTIAEERTLGNEELVAGLQSAFHNLGNLETIMEGKNGKDAQEGLQFFQ